MGSDTFAILIHKLGGFRFRPRGKSGGTQKVALPEGYLDQRDDDTPPPECGEDLEAALQAG